MGTAASFDMSLFGGEKQETLDVFNINPYPLHDHDTLEDLIDICFNTQIQDPSGQHPPMIRPVATIKNPCSAHFICVYFLQYDGLGHQIYAEHLSTDMPLHISASIHAPFGEVISTLGPYNGVVNPAERMFIMDQIRKAYMSLPYILARS